MAEEATEPVEIEGEGPAVVPESSSEAAPETEPEAEPEAEDAEAAPPASVEGEAAEGGTHPVEPGLESEPAHESEVGGEPEEVLEPQKSERYLEPEPAEDVDEVDGGDQKIDEIENQVAESMTIINSMVQIQDEVPEIMTTASTPIISASERILETRSQAQKKHMQKVKSALGSVIDIRTGSVEAGDRKTVRYANTYKLESENPFNVEKVEKILESVMMEAFENLTYEREKVLKQVNWASTAIRTRVKELEFERYKIICVVTIGEKTSQDVFVACRFLWDAEKDRYSFYSLENTFVYGIAMCFGLYYE